MKTTKLSPHVVASIATNSNVVMVVNANKCAIALTREMLDKLIEFAKDIKSIDNQLKH